MAGKGRTKSKEKRQQILVAATELFIQEGFTRTSMDDIAVRAQVSKQTVYSHFQSKEALFKESIEQKCEDFGLTEAFFEEPRPAEETLLELARHFVSLLLSEEPIAVLRLCIAEAETHPEVAQLFFSTGPEQLTTHLSKYLQTLNDKGQLDIEDSRHAAIQFQHMVRGEAHLLATLNLPGWDEEEIDRYLQRCVKVFMAGYKPA